MPKVSVITPTYNQSKLLKETVKSILQQTYTDIDVFVVDHPSKEIYHQDKFDIL